MNLKYLTDKQLMIDTQKLVDVERLTTAQVLWHLKEIDERRLYSDFKCSSLFDFCVRILKYSEGAASRRISAARLLKTMPEVITKVESGEVSLTHLNILGRVMKDEKLDSKQTQELLSKMEKTTTRGAEEKVLEFLGITEKKTPTKIKSVSTTQKNLNVNLKNDTVDKLEKLKNLLSNKNITKIEDLIDYALTKAIEFQEQQKQPKLKKAIYLKNHGKCVQCNSTHRLNLDHITPQALGGKTTAENLRVLCFNCNQRQRIEKLGR